MERTGGKLKVTQGQRWKKGQVQDEAAEGWRLMGRAFVLTGATEAGSVITTLLPKGSWEVMWVEAGRLEPTSLLKWL